MTLFKGSTENNVTYKSIQLLKETKCLPFNTRSCGIYLAQTYGENKIGYYTLHLTMSFLPK